MHNIQVQLFMHAYDIHIESTRMFVLNCAILVSFFHFNHLFVPLFIENYINSLPTG